MLKTNFDETYEKNKRMVKRTLTVMLGVGIVLSAWQYGNYRMNKEIAQLEAEKSQLELENLILKKELGEYKELQAYIEKNKKMIELLKQIDYSIAKGGK
jgi:cell division protein FtsB